MRALTLRQLKVRLQSYGNTRSLRDHIREILDGPGIKGFYRALWPTMLRAGILTSSQLGTYDEAKSVLLRRQWFAEGPQVHLVASVRRRATSQADRRRASLVWPAR